MARRLARFAPVLLWTALLGPRSAAAAAACLPSSAERAYEEYVAAAVDDSAAEEEANRIADEQEDRGRFDSEETIQLLDQAARRWGLVYDCSRRAYRPASARGGAALSQDEQEQALDAREAEEEARAAAPSPGTGSPGPTERRTTRTTPGNTPPGRAGTVGPESPAGGSPVAGDNGRDLPGATPSEAGDPAGNRRSSSPTDRRGEGRTESAEGALSAARRRVIPGSGPSSSETRAGPGRAAQAGGGDDFLPWVAVTSLGAILATAGVAAARRRRGDDFRF